MKIFIYSFFVTTIYATKQFLSLQPMIVGGFRAGDGKFPYQVSIHRSCPYTKHYCGGSILNKRWILTAAHCVSDTRRVCLCILAGTNKLFGGPGKIYRMHYIVYHSNYTNEGVKNDIALIRVTTEIEFNNRTQPIELPSEDFTKTNYPALLSGWGRLKARGRIPNHLREIKLNVIDQETCARMWNNKIQIIESHICTFNKFGEGACNGDSGGPLVADGVQIGIVSFGAPCARGYPDVFTRVYYFLDWINNQISRL